MPKFQKYLQFRKSKNLLKCLLNISQKKKMVIGPTLVVLVLSEEKRVRGLGLGQELAQRALDVRLLLRALLADGLVLRHGLLHRGGETAGCLVSY